jgi:hypothetical protein
MEVSERFADRAAKLKELHRAYLNAQAARRAAKSAAPESACYWAAYAAECSTRKDIDLPGAVRETFSCVLHVTKATAPPESDLPPEQQPPFPILRDLLGGRFWSGKVEPSWRAPEVLALARVAYDDRCFEELPLLADALEEAGCSDGELLGHLRGDGEHARGCWVLDALLGRE